MGWRSVDLVVVNQRYGLQPNFHRHLVRPRLSAIHATTPIAIEFVNWNSVSEADKENYDKVTAIIKDKVVKKEAINPGKRKPSDVITKVNSEIDFNINHYDHKCLYCCFKIRPSSANDIDDPFETNTNYCHYDEVHDDYVYQDTWAELIIKGINDGKLSKEIWKQKYKAKESFKINEFEPTE